MKLKTKLQLQVLFSPSLWMRNAPTDERFDQWLWEAMEIGAVPENGTTAGLSAKDFILSMRLKCLGPSFGRQTRHIQMLSLENGMLAGRLRSDFADWSTSFVMGFARKFCPILFGKCTANN